MTLLWTDLKFTNEVYFLHRLKNIQQSPHRVMLEYNLHVENIYI